MTLQPGDLVFLYTDGVVETIGPDGSFFGIERALDVIRSTWGESACEIVRAIEEANRRSRTGAAARRFHGDRDQGLLMRTRSSHPVLRPRQRQAAPDGLPRAATASSSPPYALMIRGNPSQPRDPDEAERRLELQDPGKDESSGADESEYLGCTHAAGTIPAYSIAKLVARRTEICPGRADGDQTGRISSPARRFQS